MKRNTLKMIKEWLGIFWKVALVLSVSILLVYVFALLAASGHYISAALILIFFAAALCSTVAVSINNAERRA